MTSENSKEIEEHSFEARSSDEATLSAQYRVLGKLGQGRYGQVRLAYHRLTGTDVVVKELKRGMYNFLIASEVALMRVLEHPHVVRLFQVIEADQHIYLVMERASGGTLWRILLSGHLKEKKARRMFQQLVWAVGYCHSRGIAHRDLKPDNILLDEADNVKLADFGLATWFMPGQKLEQVCGALAFRAPEIYLGRKYEGPQVDVWSLGIILYFMLAGALPFKGTTFGQLKMKVLKGRYALPYHLSASGGNLIHCLLSHDPARRPTVEDVLLHPWLSNTKECPPRTHSSHMLPNHLDPSTLLVMTDMGFDPCQLRDAVLHRQFNQAACTYLMLQRQKCQGLGGTLRLKPVPWRPASYPSPAHLSTFSPALKKSASAPTLRLITAVPPGYQSEENSWSCRESL
jgi:MAP/microtubule affinity-regulating kinase